MARFGKKKQDTNLEEIADLIVAEWFRVLPDDASGTVKPFDLFAIDAALNNLSNVPCRAVADEENLVHVVIPYPPAKTKQELETYLGKHNKFREDMTKATLFGCGR